MNENCVECIFCKLPRSPIAFVPLKRNLEKFENLLETFDFEQYTAKNLLICFSCNQLLNKYFDFKSNFVQKEDELLNYTDAENTADLCQVLISKGLLDENHDDEKLQICRMCYKTTADYEFTEINYGSKFSTFITTCIAEFDLFLINKTFLCPQCRNILLSFYRFLLTCMHAVKSASYEMIHSTGLQKSQSEVEALTTVPKPNVDEIMEPCSSTLDEPPDKKQKVDIDCEIIDVGPTKLEAPSDKEQANDDIRIVDVQGLLNSSTSITKNEDVIVVEPSELESPCIKEQDRGKEVPPGVSIWYQCLVCLTLCNSYYLLSKHIGEMHSKENIFICFQCRTYASTFRNLRKHLKSEHNLDTYRRVNKDMIQKHTKHSYECQICPGQYNSVDEIKKHIESHLAENIFNCWICQRILETDKVETHFKRKHGIGLYKVIEEVDEFHIPPLDSRKIVSTKIKMLECQICFHHINDIFELHEHMTYHIKSERLLCFHCTFRSSDFQIMRNHMANKHGISTLYRIIHKLDLKKKSRNVPLQKKLTEIETELISAKSPINCLTCLKEYNNTEDFIIHPCSKADNNKYCCAHCYCVLPTIDELHKHVCKETPENAKSDNSNTGKPPNENQHSKDTKHYNCSLCQISFKTSQELDNHNCTTKGVKPSNSTDQALSCGDCSGKFESYDEIIGHICRKPEIVLVQDEVKIEDEDSLMTLTAASDTSANLASNVIDIDSDSDTEFVEPNFKEAARVIREICPVGPQEASQLISQGIPVVTPDNLQYRPLIMQMPPFVSVMGQEGMLMNNGFPVMNSEATAQYLNSGGMVYLPNGNGENGGSQGMWPLPIQALIKSVEKMPSAPLNTPTTVLANNDYSQVISDDETENSRQNFFSTMSFVEAAKVNQVTEKNNDSSKGPTKEKNNYICISDDEIQETENDCSMRQEQPTKEEVKANIKRPPTAFVIYKEKLKPELDKKFPLLRPKERMQLAINTWRNLGPSEKWPFMEEARLLRELFRREHPEFCNSNTQRKKPAPKKPAETEMQVMPQISAVFTLEGTPIVLD